MEVTAHSGLEVVDPNPSLIVVDRLHDQHDQPVHSPSGKIYHPTAYAEPPSPASPPPRRTIFGLSQRTFWLAVALGFVLALAIGLGAGLGVALSQAQKDSNTAEPPDPIQTSSSLDPSAPSTTPTPTSALSSSTTTTTSRTSTSTPFNPCPSINDTVVTPPGALGTLRYRVTCGADFTDASKLTLSSFVTEEFEVCLGLCNSMNHFQRRSDVVCRWNVAGTRGETPGSCWCYAIDAGEEGVKVVKSSGSLVGVPV